MLGIGAVLTNNMRPPRAHANEYRHSHLVDQLSLCAAMHLGTEPPAIEQATGVALE